MTTKIETLGRWGAHTCSYYCDRPECIRAQRDELRQKLEQAEKPKAQRHISYVCPNCHWSLDRQPEPKPVAWIKKQELAYMFAVAGLGMTEWKTNLGLTPEPGDVPLYTAPAEKPWVKTYAGGKPNYTTCQENRQVAKNATNNNQEVAKSATTEWVGLTEQEIDQCYADTADELQFYQAIKAKLKEKNGAA